MIYRIFSFLFSFAFIFSAIAGEVRDTINLSGLWQYRLIGAPSSIPGEGEIYLPSTLDASHKSVYNPESDNTTQLRREFSFVGEASFIKDVEIPESWKNKDITLILERTKPSSIIIDGEAVNFNSRISSPQRYNISDRLSPGVHNIEIIINNSDSIPPIVARSSHAVSESTQTNWNGILGDFLLEAKNPFHIKNVRINDKDLPKNVEIIINFSLASPYDATLKLEMEGKEPLISAIHKGEESVKINLPLLDSDLWSASNPVLHNLIFTITDSKEQNLDSYEIKTGFRNFSSSDNRFTINGNPIFLRGTVNAAVFPLSTYAPLDLNSWINYFSILKEYGFNHVRFHTWTPPDAAFQAADMLGIYILTELPIWGELDRDLKFHNRFLKEELQGIMDAYAHHPSFVMFATGNELWGDLSLMGEYMEMARTMNPRILATQGSNVYLGMNGKIGDEDFLVSAKTKDNINNFIRGSISFADSPSGGYFNSTPPNSSFNFDNAVGEIDVPVISHEVGQYQSYPDFFLIDKFTGNLKPDNLKEFKKRAIEAGTFRKNKEFKEASGKWASKLYKAEMELAQRSERLAGFQIFGIQDYPGQGTALVGILDPFMESKGFITSEEWRNSSGDITILAEFPGFSFIENETIEIPVILSNYSENSDTINTILWETDFSAGSLNVKPGNGLIEAGYITLTIPEIKTPEKKTLSLKSLSDDVQNSYDFWVYPKHIPSIDNIKITDSLDEALELLKKGQKVILCPDSNTMAPASIDPLFTTDFWNYRMFRTICDEMNLKPSPGTLGLLIDYRHPALSKFPSDINTDWQWYPIIANSRPLVIDRLPKDFDPIIEVIDNVERNFRLALLLECNVGKGKLIILAADYNKLMESTEGKWMIHSIKEYMASKEFKPLLTLTPLQLTNLVTKPSAARLIKELKNETYNSNWD